MVFNNYTIKDEDELEIIAKTSRRLKFIALLILTIFASLPYILRTETDALGLLINFFIFLPIVLLFVYTSIEVSIDETYLVRKIKIGGLFRKESYKVEIEKIKYLTIDHRILSSGIRDATDIKVIFLGIELPEKTEPTHKNRLGLKIREKVKKQNKPLFPTQLPVAYTCATKIKAYTGLDIQWVLAEQPIMDTDIPKSFKIPDKEQIDNELFTIGFPGQVTQLSHHDQQEKKLLLFDRNRGLGLLVLGTSILMFGLIYSTVFHDLGAPSSEAEIQSVIILTAGLMIFGIYKLLNGYKRSYLEIQRGSIDLGWELFGFTRTDKYPLTQVEAIFPTDRDLGRRSLIFIFESNALKMGQLKNEKETNRAMRVILDCITLNRK